MDVSDPACPGGPTTKATRMDGASTSASSSFTNSCFPSAVALGSRFRITFTSTVSSGTVGNPILSAVSPEYMTSLGDGVFRAMKQGYVSIVARATVDNRIVDY